MKKIWFDLIEKVVMVFILTLWCIMAAMATDGFVEIYTIPVILICMGTGLLMSKEANNTIEEIIKSNKKLKEVFYKK